MNDNVTKESAFAKGMVETASTDQRQALLSWACELRAIKNAPGNVLLKARRALKATARRQVLAPLLRANFDKTKQVMWDDRGWPARLGIIGLSIGTLGFSGESAGLAAFGRAIAVPISLVLTVSGTALGTLIQELERKAGSKVQSTEYTIIEAHELAGK